MSLLPKVLCNHKTVLNIMCMKGMNWIGTFYCGKSIPGAILTWLNVEIRALVQMLETLWKLNAMFRWRKGSSKSILQPTSRILLQTDKFWKISDTHMWGETEGMKLKRFFLFLLAHVKYFSLFMIWHLICCYCTSKGREICGFVFRFGLFWFFSSSSMLALSFWRALGYSVIKTSSWQRNKMAKRMSYFSENWTFT